MGIVITVIVIFVAIFAPLLAPYDPLVMNLKERLSPPNAQHWMGTDHMGRDILSRVVYGAQITLQIGVISVALGTVLGLVIGALAGFYSPAAQGLMTRRVQRHEQGQLAGANSSLMGIVGMIGPGLFTSLLAWAVAHRATLPGAPFAVAAVIQLAAIALAYRVASAGAVANATPTP